MSGDRHREAPGPTCAGAPQTVQNRSDWQIGGVGAT